MADKQAHLSFDRRQALLSLAQRLGHHFNNLTLLDQALHHSSYAYEHPEGGASNERLEFLGDAVLDLTVSTLLLDRFPESSEGDLTRARANLVNARQLANLARDLDLGVYLLVGKSEERQAGRQKPSLLADALEAVLAALYLDGGLKVVSDLTERWFDPLLATALPGQDFKTSLQELTQARFKVLPSYHLLAEAGPSHARHFQVEVRLNAEPLAQGEGRTKKEAAQRAACQALEKLGEETSEPEKCATES
jgi:ribonuclease III